jgi:hypothetical protein
MEKFTVKITKCTDLRSWYADQIGEEFEVEQTPVRELYLYQPNLGLQGKSIYSGDCEIVNGEPAPTSPDWIYASPYVEKEDSLHAAKGCESPNGFGSILYDAYHAVYGDRQADYGTVTANFNTIADLWSTTLRSILKENITPEQVGLCMIQVKVARQMYKPKKDNLIDIAGYAATLEKLEKGE